MPWLLLKNSLLVASSTTLLAAALGFLAALCLAGLEARWRHLLLGAAIAGLALPPFLVTNCWLHYLGQTGVWRGWLPFDIVSLGGTVWILGLLLWPITLLAVASAWRRLQPSQLESDPAVTGWWLIRALLWPLGRTALAQATVLTFVLALNNFAVPAILQVKVFPAEVWVRFNTTFDTAGVLGLSWPLVLGPLLLLAWFARREFAWPAVESAVSAKLFRQQLGPGWFWACGACTFLLCLLAVGLPLFQLISVKRTWTELPGALAAGQLALQNSAFFAAASATVLLGLALSYHASRITHHAFNSFNPANLFNCLLWLPFLVPGVLLGIGLIVVFNRPVLSAFYQSAGIVVLAFVIRYAALGWTTVVHALRATDPDLTDFARLNGASGWQMLRHVFWPQIAPRAAAAWYVVFLLCLWDVETMILVVPPGGETLALRIFNLLHYGHNAQVNALCLTLLAVALAPLAIWKGWPAVSRSASRTAHRLSRFTFHVSRTGRAEVRRRRITHRASHILTALAVLLLPGCTPSSPSTEAPLASQLFSSVQIIGTRGVGVGELNKPRSVAVDLQDNLFVVDMTGRVQKFSPAGAFELLWQMPQTDLGKPKGMGRDQAGNIIVVEPHYQRVNHFTPDGKLIAQWGQRGTNAGQLSMPRAVAVNSRDEIFVSEYGAVERVQKFVLRRSSRREEAVNERQASVSGKPGVSSPSAELDQSLLTSAARNGGGDSSFAVEFLSSFGRPGNGPGEFNRPEGLCVDSHDRVHVADSCNHRIQIFSSDGAFLRAYGKPGTGLGELSYPYDICVDAAGRQYVCEFGNSRIQVFDANDRPIEIIGGPGAEPGRFSNPWGVALDSAGNLYVADSQNHRVQKLISSPKSKVQSPKSNASDPMLADFDLSGNSSLFRAERVATGELWLPGFGVWTLDFGL